MNVKIILKKILRPQGKISFIYSLKPDAAILDVGCGNNSPHLTKSILPNSHYTGLDVGDYNQTAPNSADKYIVVKSEDFAEKVAGFFNEFDAIISSHNLEHCLDRAKVLNAILRALKPGGVLYLSFPSEKSASLPIRKGSLNYYSDLTHREAPPSFMETLGCIEKNGFDIIFQSQMYKPAALWALGLLFEPISKITGRVYIGTWEYHGFESIVIAKKKMPTLNASI